ncbi:A24 family peptidase [Paenibacillus sp. GXUN7292]|uniref:A24 family peptidase n=1 Tax=Paenibacillus sp. GXUN7292 TaxID=3422499 RepID=UPI003D7EB0E7
MALYTDIRRQLIPNRLIVCFLIGGVIYQVVWHGVSALWPALTGMLCGFIPLFLIYVLKGIGAGDVKLFAVIGLWSGVLPVLQLTMYSIIYAGLIGIVLLIFQSGFIRKAYSAAIAAASMQTEKKHWLYWAQSGRKFPFMLAVAPAFATVWF